MTVAAILYGNEGSRGKSAAVFLRTLGIHSTTFDGLRDRQRARLFFASLYSFAVVDLDSFSAIDKLQILLYAREAIRPITFVTENGRIAHIASLWLTLCCKIITRHPCRLRCIGKAGSGDLRALVAEYIATP